MSMGNCACTCACLSSSTYLLLLCSSRLSCAFLSSGTGTNGTIYRRIRKRQLCLHGWVSFNRFLTECTHTHARGENAFAARIENQNNKTPENVFKMSAECASVYLFCSPTAEPHTLAIISNYVYIYCWQMCVNMCQASIV